MNKLRMTFGSPGTGKTTSLMGELVLLLKIYRPDEIAFVSFTKKGAEEGRDRAIEKFRYRKEAFPFFKTIHALAFKALELSRYDVIGRTDYRELSKTMGLNFLGFYTEELKNNDDMYLHLDALYKNNEEIAKRFLKNNITFNYKKFKYIQEYYEKFKSVKGVIDFTDMLIRFLEQDICLPVKVAIIDEAQDLTMLQWRVCEKAFRDCELVIIAGDDDQSIYEWAGADVKKFLSYVKRDKSNIQILNKSWRLKQNIFDISTRLVKQIHVRIDKEFVPSAQGGDIHFYSKLSEVDFNSEETYYLLARNNSFLKKYEEHLQKLGLMYTIKKNNKIKESIDKPKFNAIKEYEYLRQNCPDIICKNVKVMSFIRKDINIKQVQPVWYNALELTINEENYFRKLIKNKTDIKDIKIHINTIHGVKGGEADNVVLLMDMSKETYNKSYIANQEGRDSELRCIYVAMTRSKKGLYFIQGSSSLEQSYEPLISSLKD